MRLLFAEDDAALAATVARGLRENAYAVDVATDGDAAVMQVALNDYDALVLDVGLPKRDGFSVCREVRARGLTVPILMLTARDAVSDRVAGLDAGADDYLTKPFAFPELLARLRALRRRVRSIVHEEVRAGDLTVDTGRQTVRWRGVLIPVTTKEYALLEFLARNANIVMSRADISAHVWDDNHDPASNALEVAINRLRRKLETATGGMPLVHTRRGAGYVLSVEDDAARK
ncbi:MAG: response regulator transcription factor [Gemmatimonadaceae bacterium]|nr:response regulator transcription factor [Gemmatimonadaceae bacterium]